MHHLNEINNVKQRLTVFKAYLTTPSILASPIRGKPLVLHITAFEHSLITLLAQENVEGQESTLYYLNQMLGRLVLPIEKV